MGATGIIIGLAVIGITLLLGWGLIAPIAQGLLNNVTNTYTSTQLLPRVGEDEIICDLKLSIPAELTSNPLKFNSPHYIVIDVTKVGANFFDCHNFSNFPTLSLLDYGIKTQQLGQLTVVSFGESIDVELTLRDTNDSTQKVDKFTQPALATKVKIPATFSLNSVDASVEFVVTNIPLRNYNAEVIYKGFPINDDEAPFGAPYIFSIDA